MRLPRSARICFSDFERSSSPSNRMEPAAMRAAGGSSRIKVRARVVLPEPDSPTMPRVFPASRLNDTSSTARVTRVPRAPTYWVDSPETSRRPLTIGGAAGRT